MKKENIPVNVFILLFFLLSGFCNAQIITTVAGNGTSGFSGDGGLATASENAGPGGNELFDNAGNLYFGDQNNARIRKINLAGIIQTIGGNGTVGYAGDGGPELNAEFNQNTVLTFDSSRNMYVVDYGNNCIRKITTLGIVSTFAGTGTPGYSGDGGPATAAELMGPCCAISDSVGNIYIADSWNNVIRKVDTKGIITLFAGNGAAGYGGDGGPATSAQLYCPFRIVLDKHGEMYIADSFNNRIRKVSKAGIITTVAGIGSPGFSGDGGPATSAELSAPYGVCVDGAGDIFIADAHNNRIREVNSSGIINTIAGTGNAGFSGDGGSPLNAELNFPACVTYHDCGLYISDYNNYRIRKIEYSSLSVTASKDTLCSGQSTNLTASGGNSYTWAPATGLSCTNCPNPIASPTVTTTYTVTGNASGPCGGTASITITVDTFNLRNLTITKDTAICSGTSITLKVGGGRSYQWSTGNTTSSISIKNDTSASTYTVTVSDGACEADTSVTVKIKAKPHGNVNGNLSICLGKSTTLAASGGTSYKWNTGATTSSITISPSSDTKYSVAIIQNGCADTVSKLVRLTPANISICCDSIITVGQNVQLISSGGTKYLWSPPTGLSCDTCASPIATPSQTTTYTLTYTYDSGCMAQLFVTIDVRCDDIFIPNVFTPGYPGPVGLNNVFYIKALGLGSWDIVIYDRWGKEMFHTTNPTQYWDGNTESGGKAPDGVYYYIINGSCQNNSFKKEGFVQLIR